MGRIGYGITICHSKEELEDFYKHCLGQISYGNANSAELRNLGEATNMETAKLVLDKNYGTISGLNYVTVYSKKIPKTTQDIMTRRNNEEQKLKEYIQKNNCYDRKSTTIGCKQCGSSLATKYMAQKKLNKCPLCGAELRNNTVIETIQRYKANIKKYEKQYEEALDKAKMKPVYVCSGSFYDG